MVVLMSNFSLFTFPMSDMIFDNLYYVSHLLSIFQVVPEYLICLS